MRKRQNLWGAIAILLSLALICACDSMNTETKLGPNSESGILDDQSVMTELYGDGTVVPFSTEDPETGEQIEGAIYFFGSLHGEELITETSNDPYVQSEMLRLGPLGYYLVKENSKLIEADVDVPVDSGIAVHQNVILSFAHVSDTTKYAYISRVSLGDYAVYVQAGEVKLHSAPNDTMFYYAGAEGEDLWLRDYPARFINMENDVLRSQSNPGYHALDPDWNIGRWLKCVAGIGAGGCATAAIGCLLGAPAWAPCFGIWCLASIGGAEVTCAIGELFDWLGWDEEEDSLSYVITLSE